MELFGDGIDAFYPVLRTDDIGNIGTICCSDGEYPEAVRALAFNGAEVVYRPSEAVPMTQMGMEPGGTWLLQNRAHAHFNNVYMVCPNVGPVDEIYRANMDRLVARGSFTPPAHTFPGARYIAPAASPDEADWEQVRSLWTPPAEE